jgi:hypothetical protein
MKVIGIFLVLFLVSSGVSVAAPDPVPSNGLYYVSHAQVTVGSETFTDIAYDVRLSSSGNAAPNDTAAPACHASATLTFCCNIAQVTKPSGVTVAINGSTLTLGNVPTGSSRIVMRVKGVVNIYANALPYTMTTDDGRTYNKTTDGVRCGPNAVTLSGLSAAGLDDGQVARNVVLLVLLVGTALLVRWALQKGK